MALHNIQILPELWVKVLSYSINFLIDNPPSCVVGIPQSAWLGEHDVASMKSATNFVQYCTEHYDEWALQVNALVDIDVNDPELAEFSTTQFWDIFLRFYHDMWLLSEASERNDRALRLKVCGDMLQRWFSFDPRELGCLEVLNNATTFCFTSTNDPWLWDTMGPSDLSEQHVHSLWMDGKTFDPRQSGELEVLGLQLAKRKAAMLGTAISNAVLADRFKNPGAQALIRLVHRLFEVGPHDMALGLAVTSMKECQECYPMLHIASSGRKAPYCTIVVVRPHGAVLANACTLYIQGAVEFVRQLCEKSYVDNREIDITDEWQHTFDKAWQNMEYGELTVLACAQLQHITTDSLEGIKDWSNFNHVWQQLQDLPPFTFLSLVGVHEPRIHPMDSIQRLKGTGTRICFASEGSARETKVLAQRLGILESDCMAVDCASDLETFTAEDWNLLLSANSHFVLSRASADHREFFMEQLLGEEGREKVAASCGFVSQDAKYQPGLVLAESRDTPEERHRARLVVGGLPALLEGWVSLGTYGAVQ
uniref:Uncharacterized protein n=1 Tax=Eutreptiella gymnastica TaxID=73025 RepID=A0A7S1JAK4_9EUGL|mmetsp:Transcript_7974/g.14206  ORF Transcript_7974/g.14206 Transcript_7974/m.14206 type:complete len:537 (+) Transcript_7974:36-1646(+)